MNNCFNNYGCKWVSFNYNERLRRSRLPTAFFGASTLLAEVTVKLTFYNVIVQFFLLLNVCMCVVALELKCVECIRSIRKTEENPFIGGCPESLLTRYN